MYKGIKCPSDLQEGLRAQGLQICESGNERIRVEGLGLRVLGLTLYLRCIFEVCHLRLEAQGQAILCKLGGWRLSSSPKGPCRYVVHTWA